MDILTILASVLGSAGGLFFAYYKLKSFFALKHRESIYASALHVRKNYKDHFIVKELRDGKRVINKIIINDRDMNNLDNIKTAYRHVIDPKMLDKFQVELEGIKISNLHEVARVVGKAKRRIGVRPPIVARVWRIRFRVRTVGWVAARNPAFPFNRGQIPIPVIP